MRRVVGWLPATLVLLGGVACAQKHAEITDCSDFVQPPSQYATQFAGRAGQQSQTEFTFVCHAAVNGQAQMIYATMAQRQGASPAVRQFANKVFDDQLEMNRRLTRIAIQQVGVTPPSGLDAAHLKLRDQLARLSGEAFDRAYLQSTVLDSQATIALVRTEMSSGEEPTLNRFAGNTLPRLEERLATAQSLLQ